MQRRLSASEAMEGYNETMGSILKWANQSIPLDSRANLPTRRKTWWDIIATLPNTAPISRINIWDDMSGVTCPVIGYLKAYFIQSIHPMPNVRMDTNIWYALSLDLHYFD